MALSGEQRTRLREAQLRALVRAGWDLDLPPGTSGADGPVVARVGDRCFVLVEELRRRRMSAPLLLARDPSVTGLDVLVVDDPEHLAGHLARHLGLFGFEGAVHRAQGQVPVAVPPAPRPDPTPPPGGVETLVAVLAAAGLEVQVESGVIRGERLGLEVARIVDGDEGPRLEVGVGAFDRATSALLHAERPTSEALAMAVAEVGRHRRPGAPTHPVRDLRPERWWRARLVQEPGRVGAADLTPVPSALPSERLRDLDVAMAVGTGVDGEPVVVAVAGGTDVDAPARAADAADWHAPRSRFVLASIGPPAPPIRALAGRLRRAPALVQLPPPWAA